MQKGKTALHHAAEEGSQECLKLLVHEFQADPEEVDIVRYTVNVAKTADFLGLGLLY